MARKNRCNIILSDRRLNYDFEVKEQFLEEFLNDNLDKIILNEVPTRVNVLRITTTKEGVIIDSGITKRLFSFLKNILLIYEGNKTAGKAPSK